MQIPFEHTLVLTPKYGVRIGSVEGLLKAWNCGVRFIGPCCKIFNQSTILKFYSHVCFVFSVGAESCVFKVSFDGEKYVLHNHVALFDASALQNKTVATHFGG